MIKIPTVSGFFETFLTYMNNISYWNKKKLPKIESIFLVYIDVSDNGRI